MAEAGMGILPRRTGGRRGADRRRTRVARVSRSARLSLEGAIAEDSTQPAAPLLASCTCTQPGWREITRTCQPAGSA